MSELSTERKQLPDPTVRRPGRCVVRPVWFQNGLVGEDVWEWDEVEGRYVCTHLCSSDSVLAEQERRYRLLRDAEDQRRAEEQHRLDSFMERIA